MTTSVPVNIRCSCGISSERQMSPADATWACSDCGRRWQADETALITVTRAAAGVRRLQRLVLTALALTVIAAIAVALIHPGWLVGLPTIIGGLALITAPTYRKRLRHERSMLRSPITVGAV